jgi:hypothetical protein
MDEDAKYKVGDNVCEILLKNANDGTCAYNLLSGMFRIRCLNSLVTQSSTLGECRVRHSGDQRSVIDNVIEGTYTVLDAAQKALAAPQDWGQITLNQEQKMAFAQSAHFIRFADAEDKVDTPIKPQQLLHVRRTGDSQNDLWTTFNVIQENALKGGLRGVNRDEYNRRVGNRITTRQVNGIDQDIKLNKALWLLAENMAKLAA